MSEDRQQKTSLEFARGTTNLHIWTAISKVAWRQQEEELMRQQRVFSSQGP